jgi:outer membrane protein OmpA-like peptidoglycan-associated protein
MNIFTNSRNAIKKTMIGLFLALPFISNGQGISANLVDGTWQGILIQANNDYTDNFAYWVSLNVKEDSVFGVIRTEHANTPYYAIVNIRGKVNDNTITFTQDKIIKENPRPEAFWCLIAGELKYDSTDTSLSGKWKSEMKGCDFGSILIYKSPKPINRGATVIPVYSDFKHVETLVKKRKPFNAYKVILSKVNFETNSHKIRGNTANKEVNRIYSLLTKNEVLHVNIQGHTDNVGGDAFNMTLSYRRAVEIYNLLIAKGVKTDRISYEGYGKSRPIATNETEAGKLKNRRVEIELEMLENEKTVASANK